MASAYSIIMNCAMQIEREQTLKAESHQRTADRQGYANGFKPKALRTRVGEVHLRIPQTRDYHDEEGRPFYPKSLDRGVRSERAMTLAVAEMYVQGVSTRKVTKIVEQLCGLQVTSTQVSRAAAELDEQLAAWRNRPLGEIAYLILDARYEKVRHGGAVVPCAVNATTNSSVARSIPNHEDGCAGGRGQWCVGSAVERGGMSSGGPHDLALALGAS